MTARRHGAPRVATRARPIRATGWVASGASLRPRILLVEDDAELRALLAWSLRREDYEVTECADGRDLVSKLATFVLFGEPTDFDLVISDIRMAGATALEILEAMRECKGFPPVILITAFGDEDSHSAAERLGVAALFDKPIEIDDFLAKVQELLGEDPSTTRRRGNSSQTSLPGSGSESHRSSDSNGEERS